jgi:hypothetical protein
VVALILLIILEGRSFDTYPVNSFEAESRNEPFWILATPSTSIEVRRNRRRYQIKLRLRFLVESKSELKPDTPY